MKARQLMGLWIVALLWAITIFVWYLCDSFSWGLTQFFQATFFWGVFGVLIYFTLGNDSMFGGNNKIVSKEKMNLSASSNNENKIPQIQKDGTQSGKGFEKLLLERKRLKNSVIRYVMCWIAFYGVIVVSNLFDKSNQRVGEVFGGMVCLALIFVFVYKLNIIFRIRFTLSQMNKGAGLFQLGALIIPFGAIIVPICVFDSVKKYMEVNNGNAS